MQIRPFLESDEASVIALWVECGLTRSWNDPHKDIRRKLKMQREMFLVLEVEGRVVASIMAGYEGHRGWVNYLAVSPSQRRKGYGTTLMRHVEEMLVQAGCPKINLQIRADNTAVLEFYRRLGYARDDVVSLGRRLIPDEPAG